MTKTECEELFNGVPLTDREYQVVDTVYLYYPAIRKFKESKKKQVISNLYTIFGKSILYDMFERAEQVHKLYDRLRVIDVSKDKIQTELIRLNDCELIEEIESSEDYYV